MTAQAVLLALASNVCFVGLVASLYRPVWFRANGRVPSRWKIGGIWLALTIFCALLSLNAGFRSPSEADPTPNVWTRLPVSDTVTPPPVPLPPIPPEPLPAGPTLGIEPECATVVVARA